MYDDDDNDDEALMTSIVHLVHRKKKPRSFRHGSRFSSSMPVRFSPCFSLFLLVLCVRDDVSQCVDMKMQENGTALATITTGEASRRFRGLIQTIC